MSIPYPDFSKCSFYNVPIQKNAKLLKRIDTLEKSVAELNIKLNLISEKLKEDDLK